MGYSSLTAAPDPIQLESKTKSRGYFFTIGGTGFSLRFDANWKPMR